MFFLLANPAYFLACEEEQEQFTFGEEEMLTLVDQVNVGTWQADQYQIKLSLNQSSQMARLWNSRSDFIAVARACGDRSFVKSASACIDMSRIPLSGEVTISRLNEENTLEVIETLPVAWGELAVMGLDLTNASVTLNLQGDGSVALDWRSDSGDEFQLSSFTASDVGPESLEISYRR